MGRTVIPDPFFPLPLSNSPIESTEQQTVPPALSTPPISIQTARAFRIHLPIPIPPANQSEATVSMPHAMNGTMSQDQLTNGETPSSKFLSHVTSYPMVNDGIETFKQHPVGKKSLEIADGAYQRVGKPVEPYLQQGFNYVKPYYERADEMADSGLGHVDHRFPIVKEDTHTVIDTAKSYAFWPYNYVWSTWNDEYRKTANHNNRGAGLSTSLMAIVSTELKIASDFFQALADFLGPKYEESKKKGADYVRNAEDKAEHYKHVGQEKLDEYTHLGQQKADEYKKAGEEKTEEFKGQAKETKEQAKGAAEQTKQDAQKKTQQASK